MASIDIFNGKAFVPDWMAKWWEFDQAFSAKVMAGDWRAMKEKDLKYAGIQALNNMIPDRLYHHERKNAIDLHSN